MKIRGWTKTRQGIRKCRGPEHSRPVPFLSTLVYKANAKSRSSLQAVSRTVAVSGIPVFALARRGRIGGCDWPPQNGPAVVALASSKDGGADVHRRLHTLARAHAGTDPEILGKRFPRGRHGGASAVEGTVYEEPTRAIGSAEVTVGLPRSSRSSAGSLSTSAAFAQLHRYRSSRGEAISILVSGTWVGRRCNRTGPSGVLTQRVAL